MAIDERKRFGYSRCGAGRAVNGYAVFPDWQGNIPVIYFSVQDNFRVNGTVTEYDSHNLELDEHMQPIDKDDPEQIRLYEKYKDEIRYFASRVHEVWDFWEVPEE